MPEIRRRDRLDQPQEPGRIRLPKFDPEVFGQWSEGIARYMGTAKFLVYMTVVIVVWIGWNALALPFDPFPFMFLTLFLSLQASYSAPLILLAQNRQTDRDRIASEEDRRRATMQKADTEYLAREIASLRVALGEVATRDFVRTELARLAEELDEQANRRQRRLEKAAEKVSEKLEKKTSKQRKPAKLDEPIDADSYDPEHAEPL
ncbi:DUF1003 domain-containing protein [Catenuloplanes japonicus]|uniref:DUF1003 domain-containing protein n=1 Tax=Catenuloplanes japonicus TaxID=33876 RepID=UPI00068F63B8|nr:DUF1003 domain-containing protein [Catenuloplanes japonicus]